MVDRHLMEQLRKLKLGGFAETLELRAAQAHTEEFSHLAFLALMLQDEIERREAKKLAVRLQKASFEEPKTLEGFDFAFNPKIKRGTVTDLATCRFVENRDHILIYGPAGVGKTHLAQAIGHEACRRGYSVLFVKATKMLRYLFAARADQSWEKSLKKYLHPDLLIIDDFGLTVLTPIQAEDVYEVVTERHLRSSIVITSNRPPQDWVALFPDPVMANSALDRLSHHAHHIMIDEGESYRKKLRPGEGNN
jgi:DNA replication protein DnaC